MYTIEEQRKFAKEQFSSLRLPYTWKLEGYDTVRLHPDSESELQSIGAIYIDMSTQGINLKRYRIAYHVYSKHLSIAEKSIVDFGKFKYTCLTSNKTAEQLSDFIQQQNEND